MKLKAVLFDFDGTLTAPGAIHFQTIRQALGCPEHRAILEFIRELPHAKAVEAARLLDQFEEEAARKSKPNAGSEEIVRFLTGRGLKVGILSRNSLKSIRLALENFPRLSLGDFTVVISRDDACAPKPSAEGILAAAGRFGCDPGEILVVGDFEFDVQAGSAAGARTVYLTNGGENDAPRLQPDHVIAGLRELEGIVESLTPLPAGKLPNSLLKKYLAAIAPMPGVMLLSPGVGQDAAAVLLNGEEVLVIKADPVTLAGDAIGRYAVDVNVNDIATTGAIPRWLTVTLLFPNGTTPHQIGQAMSELKREADRRNLVLCGGHTEVTDAVTRTIVSAQVLGTVSRRGLIGKDQMRPADRILLTKRIAIEGTSIIAQTFHSHLLALGASLELLSRCRELLSSPGISIVTEARIAAETGGVSAMHDVTEGGLATAVRELAESGGCRICIHGSNIPVYPETAEICRLLGLDPMGLIGSGTLLIACRPASAGLVAKEIRGAGIEVADIGEVLGGGEGVEMRDRDGGAERWPSFDTDEITRLFRRLADPPDGPARPHVTGRHR